MTLHNLCDRPNRATFVMPKPVGYLGNASRGLVIITGTHAGHLAAIAAVAASRAGRQVAFQDAASVLKLWPGADDIRTLRTLHHEAVKHGELVGWTDVRDWRQAINAANQVIYHCGATVFLAGPDGPGPGTAEAAPHWLSAEANGWRVLRSPCPGEVMDPEDTPLSWEMQ